MACEKTGYFLRKIYRKMSKYCHGKLCIAYQLVIILVVCVFFIFLDVHNLRVIVIALSCIVFVLLVVNGVLISWNRRSESNNRTTTRTKTSPLTLVKLNHHVTNPCQSQVYIWNSTPGLRMDNHVPLLSTRHYRADTWLRGIIMMDLREEAKRIKPTKKLTIK